MDGCPYTNAGVATYDSGDYAAGLDGGSHGSTTRTLGMNEGRWRVVHGVRSTRGRRSWMRYIPKVSRISSCR